MLDGVVVGTLTFRRRGHRRGTWVYSRRNDVVRTGTFSVEHIKRTEGDVLTDVSQTAGDIFGNFRPRQLEPPRRRTPFTDHVRSTVVRIFLQRRNPPHVVKLIQQLPDQHPTSLPFPPTLPLSPTNHKETTKRKKPPPTPNTQPPFFSTPSSFS